MFVYNIDFSLYCEMALYCIPFYFKVIVFSGILASVMMEVNKRFFSDGDELL